MKSICLVLCVILCVAFAADNKQLNEAIAADDFESFVEVSSNSSNSTVASYLPDSGPYDNPATDTQLVKMIPQTPSCTIRGQTIFEIRKMRSDAKAIGMSIMFEVQVMEKRKAYIEQMTMYLNDRIRELNKVKTDLSAEQKWIQVANARIMELAQKEKLIKLQDVMTCIKTQQESLVGESYMKETSLKSLDAQAALISDGIKTIQKQITSIVNATNT